MGNEAFEMSELYNRFLDTVVVGFITEISKDGRQARIKLRGAETPFMILSQEMSGDDEEFSAHSIGERVIAVCPEGKLEFGVIIRSIPKTGFNEYGTKYKKKFADKTEITYDKQNSVLNIDMKQGKLNLKIGDSIIEATPETINITVRNVNIKSENAVIEANTIELKGLNEVFAGGIVTSSCPCSFTGAPHPVATSSVKIGIKAAAVAPVVPA